MTFICVRNGEPTGSMVAGVGPLACLASLILVFSPIPAWALSPRMTPAPPGFRYQEVMIPMRDGVRLQTAILTPLHQASSLPILLHRSPYGIPEAAPIAMPRDMAALARTGYIFALQNVRGRFKSGGTFQVAPLIRRKIRPGVVNDVTDAYDTIQWLVKHVPNNNGRVGLWGVSYAGMTAALPLIDPPPALKAVSEQGASADEWLNDDFHHYGAFRLSYAFEYAVMEEAARDKNSAFQFDRWDAYEWYLGLASARDANSRYLHGDLPFWNDLMAHPDYDQYWQARAWAKRLRHVTVPVLNVAGYWDQEDPHGPWQIFREIRGSSPGDTDLIVAGPWNHGAWALEAQGNDIGGIALGQDTARQFREDIEVAFFRYYLHGEGKEPDWRVASFQTGSDVWRRYLSWPPKGARQRNLYLHCDGSLALEAPERRTAPTSYRQYVSDPVNPVPYALRPIAPVTPNPTDSEWATWEVADQRFVDHRPDVLTYVSEPLKHSLTITGPIKAVLFAATSGTDTDFIVKLIDVYPENYQGQSGEGEGSAATYRASLNGYELPIAMEIRRGRYLKSFSHPMALKPGVVTKWVVPLGDHDHVFLAGHRIMVQIQSSWFPLYDMNPQKFVPNIYLADRSDYSKAIERVYSSGIDASRIVLPVVPSAAPGN
jgi:uncharacterized protein